MSGGSPLTCLIICMQKYYFFLLKRTMKEKNTYICTDFRYITTF